MKGARLITEEADLTEQDGEQQHKLPCAAPATDLHPS